MEFKFECSHCGQHISAPRELIGTTAACPSCATELIVPDPEPVLPRSLPVKANHTRRKSTKRRVLKWFLIGCGAVVVSIYLVGFVIFLVRDGGKNPVTASADQKGGLPPDVATDAELDNDLRGIVFVAMIGAMQGQTFWQQFGRAPTKAEYYEILEALHMNRPEEVSKDEKEARVNRRLAYEFRRAFQAGCKSGENEKHPAF